MFSNQFIPENDRSDHLTRIPFLFLILILPFAVLQCDIADSDEADAIFDYDFRESAHNWEPFFSGYFVGDGEKMNLESDYRPFRNHWIQPNMPYTSLPSIIVMM